MVLKGQFLERMTTVMSGELHLEGLFHEGARKPGVVVAAPHPALGGSMDSAVCAELAWAITRHGYPSLRFNYRGVGASQGKGHQVSPTADEERADLCAAMSLMSQTSRSPRVNVVGYSFGGWVASHVAMMTPRTVEKLVVVSPPTSMMPFDLEALAACSVPVRIIIGGKDSYADVAALEKQCTALKLECFRVPEGDHFFLRGLAEVGKLAAEFLAPDPGLLELEESDGPPLELDLDRDG